MDVIGVGLSRTGTTSLKWALAFFGHGPAYHGNNLFTHPHHVDRWLRVAKNPNADLSFLGFWKSISGDTPAFALWRTLCARWPDAPVILTVRDPEEWCDSYLGAIVARHGMPHREHVIPLTRPLVWDGFFEGKTDRATLIRSFKRHTEEVRDTIDPQRLLVFDVREGWEPLAAHLGKRPPATLRFPRLNSVGRVA